MKKVYSKYFPVKGYLAMTFWPWIIIRKDQKDKFDATAERHENTHGLQQVEVTLVGIVIAIVLLILGCEWYSLIPLGLFFEWYCLEYIIKAIFTSKAYYSISFEQEAYDHEEEVYYNEVRKHFAWMRYIFKTK